ncbi:MAG: metallophosphoesterase family protein [Thermoplasmata archaeon]
MRLLALADIHSSSRGADAILRMVEGHRPDALVVAGDLTSFGPAEFVRELMRRVPVPALTVPGNCDPPDVELELSREPAVNLNLRRLELCGVAFVGLAGWQVPPALGEWGFPPHEAARRLEGLLGEGDVLITHVPPLGHVDIVPGRPYREEKTTVLHAGCVELARAVRRCRPALVISGHIHEARGIEEEGGTIFVNPGPAREGFGAIIELRRGGDGARAERKNIQFIRG